MILNHMKQVRISTFLYSIESCSYVILTSLYMIDWEYQFRYKIFSDGDCYENATILVLCVVLFLNVFAYFGRDPRKVLFERKYGGG